MLGQNVKLNFSRKKLADQFFDWVEKSLQENGQLPWFNTSETMMVISSVNREDGEISFTGMSAGVEEEEAPQEELAD